MARGSQADLGGLRVDRPMWSGPAGLPRKDDTPSPRPPDPDRPRRLPKMRQYLPPTTTPTPIPGRTGGAERPPVRPPVDIDLTADDPARRPVDIDLTQVDPTGRVADPDPNGRVPLPSRSVAARPAPAPAVARTAPVAPTAPTGPPPLVDPPEARGGPDHGHPFSPTHHRWLSRRMRRVRRRLGRPATALCLERSTLVLAVAVAVLLTSSAMATGVRATLRNDGAFLALAQPLHRDPDVADDLARRLTASLTAEGAVRADDAAEVEQVIEAMVLADDFGPVWRSALERAHDQAMGGIVAPATDLEQILPGLPERLEAEGMGDASAIGARSVQVVRDDYVAQLRRVVGMLDRIVQVAPPALVLLAIITVVRSRNRLRAASLLAAATAGVALAAMAFVVVLGASGATPSVSEAVRPLAAGAADGVLPPVRLTLAFVAIVGATLAVAGRLEEVRLAPYVAVEHPQQRRARRAAAAAGSAGLAARGEPSVREA